MYFENDDEESHNTRSAQRDTSVGSSRLFDDDGISSAGGGRVGEPSIIQLLIEATENERHAPDILPYPKDLIDSCTVRLAEQQRVVRELADEERAEAARANQQSLLPFKPSDIMAIEIRRIQFFLTELLRCRVRKIQALSASLLHEGRCESDESLPRVRYPLRAHLSLNERIVADRVAEMTQRAVRWSGLHAAPEPLQLLTPNPPLAEGMEILPEPDMNAYVFAIALVDLGVVQLGDGIEQSIHAGELFLIPYASLRTQVIAGQVRLV